MTSDDQALLFELFADTARQAPGSVDTTRRALGLLPPALRVERVLDLGCGTGGSTLVLAEATGADIVAVDIHPPFLATLRARAETRHLTGRLTTIVADMADTSALGSGYDVVWAEGSAYSMGFERALRQWRALLRPGGCLVVTELAWFVAEPAGEARAFFAEEYPDMRDETTRVAQARDLGYDVLGSFPLPAADWHAYYAGVDRALREAMARHGERDVFVALQRERAVYEAYGHDYGYLCLVLQSTLGTEMRRPHEAARDSGAPNRQG